MTDAALSFAPVVAQHHPYRWRLHRAGIQNVWRYIDQTFPMDGGRVIWRGSNGSGKSRALELLLPFLLDGDKAAMDSTNARKVSLDQLMSVCARGSTNRVGILWLELRRDLPEGGQEYKTIGAHARRSDAAKTLRVEHFITSLRVGHDLPLMNEATRQPLSAANLKDLVGPERCTSKPGEHRARVAREVFGLEGPRGQQRFDALISLLRTLRSPDVGNQIDQRGVSELLTEALPPLDEEALRTTGDQLDMLRETRERLTQRRDALARVEDFLGTYTAHVCGHLSQRAKAVITSVDQARGAKRDLAERTRESDAAVTQRARQKTIRDTALAQVQTLDAMIKGIETSDNYREARTLAGREEALGARESAADANWSALTSLLTSRHELHAQARDSVGAAVKACAELNEDLTSLALRLSEVHLPHQVPVALTLAFADAAPDATTVHRAKASDPEEITAVPALTAPTPTTDPALVVDALHRAQAAARARAGQARLATDVARKLVTQEHGVTDLQGTAERLETSASSERTRADEAVVARDDLARRLAHEWSTWSAQDHPALTDRPSVAVLADLVHNADHLTGEGIPGDLDAVDALVPALLQHAQDRVARERAELELAHGAAQERVAELHAEQASLAVNDPPPATGPLDVGGPLGSLPLWRTLEFAEHLPAAGRANIEAALHAAGLLTAHLHPDGGLVAEAGQVIVDVDTPVAHHSLATVLTPDATADINSDLVRQVLARIAWNDLAHPTAVAPDGSWRVGMVRGRHTATRVRYIGASARAATRRERLAQIDDELADLAAAAAARTAQLAELAQADTARVQLAASAPKSHALRGERDRAARVLVSAAKLAADAQAAGLLADRARIAWENAAAAHRGTCQDQNLPVGVGDLEMVTAVLESVVDAAKHASRSVHRLTDGLSTATVAITTLDGADRRLMAACRVAGESQRLWASDAIEVAAIRASLTKDLAALDRELHSVSDERGERASAAQEADERERELGERVGELRAASLNAAARLDDLTRQVRSRVVELATLTDQDGVLEAGGVTGFALPTVEHSLDDVRAKAARLLTSVEDAAVRAPGPPTLARQIDQLREALTNTYDLWARSMVGSDFQIVELRDQNGTWPIARGRDELAEQVARDAGVISERERRVYTTFLLAGVGAELAERLTQARDLITAMRLSLKSIKTNGGIAIDVAWEMEPEWAAQLGEMVKLVLMDPMARSQEQMSQLVELLRQAVDTQAELLSEAGYYDHLRTALDYRQWHRIEVSVLGPGPKDRRPLSRRVKLSQGETRFVSYMALFAALDAFLSGLPDPDTALRLLVLDDAFAKMDSLVVGQFMGLLVDLDVDFAMTGHELWGTYPAVPSLDIYEVLSNTEDPDGIAVTSRVHWDGKNRHLVSAR